MSRRGVQITMTTHGLDVVEMHTGQVDFTETSGFRKQRVVRVKIARENYDLEVYLFIDLCEKVMCLEYGEST